MRLVILDKPEDVGAWAATYIKKRIQAFAPTEERPFVLGLPTGSSPIPVYKKLVEFYHKGELSFKNVITVNMDEYVGLPATHPESYHFFMYKHLFSHIDIDPKNVHILDGMAPDLQAECDRYEEMILSLGGIELFLAGMGPDGHCAFNESGSSLSSRTRVKTLAYDTVLANSRFFGNDLEAVPKMALTVGVGTVNDAREVVVIVTGAHKAHALQKCVEEGINHMYTSSMLQMHPRACFVCDEDATLELKVKTVRYFKQIQHMQEKMLDKPMMGYSGSLLRGPTAGFPHASPKMVPLSLDAAAAAAVGGAAAGGAGGSSVAPGLRTFSYSVGSAPILLPHGVAGETRAIITATGDMALQAAPTPLAAAAPAAASSRPAKAE